MSDTLAVWLLLTLAVLAANLPWLSDRVFFFIRPRNGVKRIGVRLIEWLVLYFVIGAIALGMERKLYGQTHDQSWEFYVVTFCLFLVFALPGFLYRVVLHRALFRS